MTDILTDCSYFPVSVNEVHRFLNYFNHKYVQVNQKPFLRIHFRRVRLNPVKNKLKFSLQMVQGSEENDENKDRNDVFHVGEFALFLGLFIKESFQDCVGDLALFEFLSWSFAVRQLA